jgi:HTH-type transcriptional regulator / antitoxin HigA
MKKEDSQNEEPDDFPMSPTGGQSGKEYYESYVKAKSLLEKVPNQKDEGNSSNTLWRMFKEVSSQSGDNSVLFRKHCDAKDALTTLWLSNIRSTAKLFISLNNIPQFDGLSPAIMEGIAKLSVDVKNIKMLPKLLSERGIVLIFEEYLPGMKLDGAVFSIAGRNPVVALSLRFPRIDSLWFSLMHELAHISLHFDRLTTPIIDDFDHEDNDLIEKEADKLALNTTISRSDWRNCEAKYDLSNEAVLTFAKRVGVHPAIVAGRLRKELNRYNIFSEIVNSVDVRKVVWG